MIKELLLSIALSAASGVSSFVGSPKKLIDDISSVYGSYELTLDVDRASLHAQTPFGAMEDISGVNDGEFYNLSIVDEDRANIEVDAGIATGGTWGFINVFWFFDSESLARNFQQNIMLPMYNNNKFETDVLYQDGDAGLENTQEGWRTGINFACDEFSEGGCYVSFEFEDPDPKRTITTAFFNCSYSSTPTLPATFRRSQAGTTYTIYAQANEDLSGSYGFNSTSLTLTGVTTSNFQLTNEIGSTGLYRGCSFSITLPDNNIIIRLEAFRPTYSIASTLNHCTASPSVATSYTGLFAEDYTFTAASGYAFNSLVPSWEFSENITAQEPTFSGRLYGSLYEKVTFRLVFENGNCDFRITAAAFNLDSYAEGYDNGYTKGYDKGHADGLIAGDSYGVWNWLKQAARTTGEFLSIPLLPGFSIGGLLTALAGLVIIWFFIKGFLFKS